MSARQYLLIVLLAALTVTAAGPLESIGFGPPEYSGGSVEPG